MPSTKVQKAAPMKESEQHSTHFEAPNKMVLTKNAGGNISEYPIEFTKDSKYFFSSVGSCVKIFSMATGAVVKVLSQSTLTGGHSNKITRVILNPKNPLQLFTASLDGTIKLWDYNDDILLKTYKANAPIQDMVMSSGSASHAYIVVKSQDKKGDNNAVYRFSFGGVETAAKMRRICSLRDCVAIDISKDGKWLAFAARFKAYVWPINKQREDVPEDQLKQHVFVEQPTVIRFHPDKPILAVGDKSGKITCISNYKSDDPKDHIRSILHWHHLPVRYITFMVDGSYLLSGGEESVMVIWQLDTGHKQFMPRLGGSIASITISPNNRFYCIGLDNNSIRFINSVTHSIEQVIQGVQYAHADSAMNPLSTGLIVEPRNHHVVLNGVPGNIQFYDAVADSHVMEIEVVPMNRVTRTGEKEIVHAHVSHVAFLRSGEWMATVDMRDDKVTTPELFLKFWRWDPDTQGYTLHTRVDYPHTKPITSLTLNPVSRQGPMAITTSEDKTFKVWNLSTDLGRSYQNGEAAWICRSVGVYRDSVPSTATFSEDGSILAVAFGQVTTLWDPYLNSIQAVLAQPNPEDIEKLSFLGENCPFLIAKSKSHLYVWNMLTCKVWWSYKMTVDHLAVDTVSNQFAVVRNHARTNESRITVYDPKSPVPLALQHLDYTCLSVAWLPKEQEQDEGSSHLPSHLLCLSNKYEMLIHSIKPASSSSSLSAAAAASLSTTTSASSKKSTSSIGLTHGEDDKPTTLLDDMYGKRQDERETDEQARIRLNTVKSMREEAMSANRKERAVKRTEHDASGLSAPSHVLPGVENLFDAFMSSIMAPRNSENNNVTHHTDAMEIDTSVELQNDNEENETQEQEDTKIIFNSAQDDFPSLVAHITKQLEENPIFKSDTNQAGSSDEDDSDDSDDEEDPSKIEW